VGLLTPALAAPAQAAPHFESRYAPIAGCHEYAEGKDGEDWVTFRCAGMGRWPLWRAYNEGVRMRIGFGKVQNYSGIYEPVRPASWKVEYRGAVAKHFEPFAAIFRASDPDDRTHSYVVVYRLRPDGASCVIGEVKGADASTKARALADASFVKFTCTEDPYMP
jgi:hypothetical protein